MKGSANAGVRSDATSLALIPTNNLGTREGYEAIDTERITVRHHRLEAAGGFLPDRAKSAPQNHASAAPCKGARRRLYW